jgi:hypothetical protein
VALALGVTYCLGRIGVDVVLFGHWSPTPEALAHMAVVPLAQSAAVWWIVGHRGERS